MTPKHIFILLLAIVAAANVAAQSEDIPVESDNQFPPDSVEPTNDVIDGSGDGAGAEITPEPEPAETTTPVAQLEEVQASNVELQSSILSPEEDQSCPKPCVCHYVGGTDDFVVDCSGYGITDFPAPIDPKTTTLNIQNNKLTELPKEVSALKNLKVLNAENNEIMELALGSVSDLPELQVLKLGNNRLIEYPRDLKNSLSLTKLEELDLGGNDMRDVLKPEVLSNFIALRNLTLAISSDELIQGLCQSLKETLQFVCTGSCKDNRAECDTELPINEEDLITLPGALTNQDDFESTDDSPNTESSITGTESTDINTLNSETSDDSTDQPPAVLGRFALNNAEVATEKNSEGNQKLLIPKTAEPGVEATTAEGKNSGGGVSKSVIGIVVACMVVVVAVVTITKNWSSIRKKFSSSPRPAERAGANSNGTSLPEEVPLQEKDKSPV
ncbi:leucine rich repeat domain-containing protein [Phthorimaea operculella]|nr:leucine rich repeat domain-containing protein [Phthorimaea operculella]